MDVSIKLRVRVRRNGLLFSFIPVARRGTDPRTRGIESSDVLQNSSEIKFRVVLHIRVSGLVIALIFIISSPEHNRRMIVETLH